MGQPIVGLRALTSEEMLAINGGDVIDIDLGTGTMLSSLVDAIKLILGNN